MLSIRAEFKRDEHTTAFNMPCNDYEIDIALSNLGQPDITQTEQYCLNIGGDVPELSVLQDWFIHIDALNFLAKRLDSFDERELNQFKAAMVATKATELKDLINLTFNLHNYTLITDFSDTAKIGRMHRLNVEGYIPLETDDGYDYKTLGESIIASENKTVTPYGVLIDNGLQMENLYNGQTFPQFLYDECLISSTLSYGENNEYLYMPCTKSEIDRAVQRIGANAVADCKLMRIDSSFHINWLDKLCPDYWSGDLYELNELSAVLTEADWKNPEIFDKLIAVCDFADVTTFGKAALIMKNLDSFDFAENALDEDDLGKYLIKESGYYTYDDALEDFYDYELLGADTAENQGGKFTEYGYIGIRDDVTLEEILGEDKAITMGGM